MTAKSKQASMPANLEAFLADKARQWERVIPLVRLINQGFSSGAATYQATLEGLKSGRPAAEIVAGLKDNIRAGHDVAASSDIMEFIQSSQPLLPADVLDMPEYVAAEQRKAAEETSRRIAAMREQHEAERVRLAEEEKRRRRARQAEDLGLPDDAFEHLKPKG